MAKDFELLDLHPADLVISHEDAQDARLFRRARAMAAERGVQLHIAAPEPEAWQPPEGSYAVRNDLTPEEYRHAKAKAAELGL